VIVATCSVAGWEGAEIGALAAATMGYYEPPRAGVHRGDTDWPRALEQGDSGGRADHAQLIEKLLRRRA